MIKKSSILNTILVGLLFNTAPLASSAPIKKIGKIAARSPYAPKCGSCFLPYNAKILTVGESSDQINSFSALKAKGQVYALIKNKKEMKKFEEIKNISFCLCNYTIMSQLSKCCKNLGLTELDAVSLNVHGNELAILNHAKSLLLTARIVFVTTHQRGIGELLSFFDKHSFTLVSYWEAPDKSGRAFFAKTAYYKGIYERRFI